MARDKNELYITVPSLFRCPISMDVMKSPVSLCTGVTYDRSSIKTWLDSGHNTCPATMQVLQSTDVVPNLTLRRLIRCWSDSLLLLPDSPAASQNHQPKLFSTVSKQQVLESIRIIIEKKHENFSNSLSKILDFARYSDENRQFLSTYGGFIQAIVGILTKAVEIEVLELIIAVIDSIVFESTSAKEQFHEWLLKNNRISSFSPFVLVLQKGKLKSKIDCASVLKSMSVKEDFRRAITEQEGLLAALFNLISSETDGNAIDVGLSALIAISSSRFVKIEIVRFGFVQTGSKIMSDSKTRVPVIEKLLKLLEIVCTCKEGRTAICEDEICATAIVQKLMKVSETATEHGIGVLHSVCYLSRDPTAQEALMKNNGVTKVLLVMQSNCSEKVKQMCGELMKVFRVNSKSSLASYETRTTHIMPY